MTSVQSFDLDSRVNPSSGLSPAAVTWQRRWLLGLALLVYAMILVGGATRLTDSGLSITDWRPISGALPPLSAERWLELFDLYRETAECRFQNSGMSMAEFQYIYWWEWAHRFFGRFIGLFAIVGFVTFWRLGWLGNGRGFKYAGLIALGGLQGAIGWWMVASGIGEETTLVDVAPYRLMTHFSLALVIIAWITWLWLDLGPSPNKEKSIHRGWVAALALVIFAQMASGALVAGLDAGRTYTDWPLMAGEFVPTGYWLDTLGLRNVFENEATAQFNHRVLAYFIVAAMIALMALTRREWNKLGLGLCAVAVAAQVVWGIVTLVNVAPLSLALVHQGLGVVVLIAFVRATWRAYSAES